mmetsp:Transcript_34405/g.59208  ORF Transcript_34405/g.59208 Transcript_34405/m.59208 type:complete len:323 (+) Transcript_34405:743-1711(+)
MRGDLIQRHHLLGEHRAEVNNNTVRGAQGGHGLDVAQFVSELLKTGGRVGREEQLEAFHALVCSLGVRFLLFLLRIRTDAKHVLTHSTGLLEGFLSGLLFLAFSFLFGSLLFVFVCLILLFVLLFLLRLVCLLHLLSLVSLVGFVLLFVLLVTLGLALGSLLGLLMLGENERSQFVGHVNTLLGSTGQALLRDHPVLNLVMSLGQAAVLAEHKVFNVSGEVVLQVLVAVCSVHDGAVAVGRVGGLRAQLAAKELGNLRGFAVQGSCDISDVHKNSFNSISTSFNFTHNAGHLIAVGGVFHRSETGNIHSTHCCVYSLYREVS